MKKIKKLIDLKNKNVLITGALGKLGFAIAETIAELNGNLFLLDLPGKNFKQLNKQIKKISNVKFKNIECDLLNFKDRAMCISKLKKNNIKLDVLINNAAFVGTSNIAGWNTSFNNQ